MANNTDRPTITLTRAELQVVFQALFLADAYYMDPNRSVRGMATPSEATIAERVGGINLLLDRITRFAGDLS